MQLNDKPRAVSPWRFRDEKEYWIAYKSWTTDYKWTILSPYETAIISFLDGKNTFEDILKIWIYLFKTDLIDEVKCQAALEEILNRMISKGMVDLEGPVSPTLLESSKLITPHKASDPQKIWRLKRPFAITLDLSNRCIADCIYCYAERARCDELTYTQVINLFDIFSENEIFIVDVGGADIFSRQDALLILEEMSKRNFSFFLSTKSHITSEIAERLFRLKIGISDALPHLHREVQISIDSTDNKIAGFLVNIKDYFYKAEDSIINLLAHDICPKVKCVLTNYNADAPELLIKHFSALGVKSFQFVQYGRSYYRHTDDLFLTKEQKMFLHSKMEELKSEYPALKIVYQDDITSGDTPPDNSLEKWDKRALCSGGRISMEINPNGDVTLCEQIPHKKEYIFGNIVNQPMDAIWNGEKMLNFLFPGKEKYGNTPCYDCQDYDKCHNELGYCYRDSLFNYGTVFDAPPGCPRQTKGTLLRQI